MTDLGVHELHLRIHPPLDLNPPLHNVHEILRGVPTNYLAALQDFPGKHSLKLVRDDARSTG